MEPEYWISELGRLYTRSTEAIEQDQNEAVEPLADEFNTSLAELKASFPENEIVQRTEPVQGRTESSSSSDGNMVTFSPSRRRDEALHEIRSRCEKMSNAIGYELPKLSQSSDTNSMVMVSVDNTQQVEQTVTQKVSVDSVMELVQHDPQAQPYEDEIRELAERFEKELEGDGDPETLRQFVEEAKEYSTGVAAKLAMMGLEKGAVGVLGI